MLSLSRRGVIGNLQRFSKRCASTSLPESKIDECSSVTALIQDQQKFCDFTVENEPVLEYRVGSEERRLLECALEDVKKECEEVPIIIGGKPYKTKDVRYQVMPHNHRHSIAKFYYATPDLVQKAIKVAVEKQKSWDSVPLQDRINIWLKGADLMATKYRQVLNSTTMLGQAKTIIQAEIDSAAELIDFFRLNAFFAKEAVKYQPISPNPHQRVTINSQRYRGLEGFVASVSPFNFTAIGGNLAFTPALMGCTTLWKPSDTALLSNYTIYKAMTEAGLPPGVVNFVPADGPVFGDAITSSPHLAGINFTGSVPTFNRLWTQVGQNINKYKNYPRLIGECGGKNFHFVHNSADVDTVVACTIRSAFEFSGQKCSACSRMYVPESLWAEVKCKLCELHSKLKIGDVQKFDSFTSAVIDKKAYDRIKGYIEHAKKSLEVIAGGKCDDSVGYFIEPTIVVSKDPKDKIMTEEIFGPVLSIYVYPDKETKNVLNLIDSSTPYALTGAVFAKDMSFQQEASNVLKYSAGNYYVNDKSTGSVVGQQPFGGSRMSGTNDKAGGPHYVLRWASPQAIKETFVPMTQWSYPYM